MTNSFSALDAVADVVGAFNKVGVTSAHIKPQELSSEPFTYGVPYNDHTPTIHVGFLKQDAWDDLVDADKIPSNAIAGTLLVSWDTDASGTPCALNEVHIAFPDTSVRLAGTNRPWSFGVPPRTTSAYATRPYYDAGVVDTSAVIAAALSQAELDDHPELKPFAADDAVPRLWFRTSFLHELLHAFGHVKDSRAIDPENGHIETAFSFLNDGVGAGLPWADRDSDEMVRPLPEEIHWLRTNYPLANPGTRYDVSVLDSWYAYQKNSDGTSNHNKTQAITLCQPSLGDDFSSDVAGMPGGGGKPSCGVNADTTPGLVTVCPGETLLTRFALTNASNAWVNVHLRLAFSLDETWGGTDDAVSHTAHNVSNLTGETSKLLALKWDVPSFDVARRGVPWYALVEASGDHFTTDWIPLRGFLMRPSPGC